MQPCIVNFNFLTLTLSLNMRNQTYAYKLVQQIFAQVVILKFFDRIDSTLPVQDIMSPSFDILL